MACRFFAVSSTSPRTGAATIVATRTATNNINILLAIDSMFTFTTFPPFFEFSYNALRQSPLLFCQTACLHSPYNPPSTERRNYTAACGASRKDVRSCRDHCHLPPSLFDDQSLQSSFQCSGGFLYLLIQAFSKKVSEIMILLRMKHVLTCPILRPFAAGRVEDWRGTP